MRQARGLQDAATAFFSQGAGPGLLWELSSSRWFCQFILFLSLKAVLVLCFFGGVSSSMSSFDLALLQPAVRTRTVSVPGDDSKSVKRNERAQSDIRVQQADPSPGPGARRSKRV